MLLCQLCLALLLKQLDEQRHHHVPLSGVEGVEQLPLDFAPVGTAVHSSQIALQPVRHLSEVRRILLKHPHPDSSPEVFREGSHPVGHPDDFVCPQNLLQAKPLFCGVFLNQESPHPLDPANVFFVVTQNFSQQLIGRNVVARPVVEEVNQGAASAFAALLQLFEPVNGLQIAKQEVVPSFPAEVKRLRAGGVNALKDLVAEPDILFVQYKVGAACEHKTACDSLFKVWWQIAPVVADGLWPALVCAAAQRVAQAQVLTAFEKVQPAVGCQETCIEGHIGLAFCSLKRVGAAGPHRVNGLRGCHPLVVELFAFEQINRSFFPAVQAKGCIKAVCKRSGQV